MNTRDILTLIGTIISALGAQIQIHGHSSTTYWTAIVCITVGPLLMGARAVIKDPNKNCPHRNVTVSEEGGHCNDCGAELIYNPKERNWTRKNAT